ncbi:MAG TPA: SMP-30/gluconolactonase/LRE family protein [Pirellulales bacterium]|jgi:gluconolactonase
MDIRTQARQLERTLRCLSIIAATVVIIAAATGMSAAAADAPIPGIGPTGPAKEIAGTFKFTEGPATDRDGVVYFTDVPVQKIYKIGPDYTSSVFRDESNGANGLMFNAAGEIVSCQKNGLVVWNPKTKKERVLADKYDGKALNRPNDLVVDATGGAYFTDPSSALDGKANQPVAGVFYVTVDGKLTRLIDDLIFPNGIILSPDEKTLYVIPFLREQMMAYPVTAPGKLGPGRVFCTIEQPEGKKGGGGDGCAVDARGNLYIAAATGVQVFDPAGKLLGTIKVPKTPSNCEFGGKDLKTLYVTARTGVYAFPMEITGHRFPGGPK